MNFDLKMNQFENLKMSIAQNLLEIKSSLPSHVTLVAVSKTKPVSDLMEAYAAGQRIFGENKIQEMTEKWQAMPKDIEWHMIGHVQSNKVKYMVPYVKLIHGVDSLKLLKEINRHAVRWRKNINCLLQIHIAEEETKFGLDERELEELLNSNNI
jgi:pyridoxal phosphate enzyme (YggS family)